MRYLFSILFLFSLAGLHGQEMRIGLLRSIKIRSLTLSVAEGVYYLYGDSTNFGEFTSGSLQVHDQGVKLTLAETEHVFKTIRIVAQGDACVLKLKSLNPASKEHLYHDDLEVDIEGGQRIRLVNKVDMAHYLAGVIESEGGGGQHIEYYKVQALMSRTYALRNLNRHKKEGFSLCDGVHCQAYHNKLQHTPTIETAVHATRGLVMVDRSQTLISTYFSANCGGQTCDASYVWNTSVPYIQSFRDTFCIHTRQATWTATVGKYSWKHFLEKEYGVTEEKYGSLIYNFDQQQRKAFYIHPSLGVPLRDLRTKFNLKSTYFSTHLVGEEVVITGRGFGHGVGLCQEGAMNMARKGYTFDQIALYYFTGVQIIDSNRVQFFRQTVIEEDP